MNVMSDMGGWSIIVFVFISLTAETTSHTAFQNFTVGNEAVARPNNDTEGGATYIPEPHKPISQGSRVTGFTFYASREGTVHLEVWRKSGGPLTFTRVSSWEIPVRGSGLHRKNVTSDNMSNNVLPGDVIGFRSSDEGVIPYTGTECWTRRGYITNTSAVTPGVAVAFKVLPSGNLPCRRYSVVVNLTSGVEFGDALKYRPNLDQDYFGMYMTNVSDGGIPWDGTVIGWRYFSRAYWGRPINMTLQVYRLKGMKRRSHMATLIGQTFVNIHKRGIIDYRVPENQQFTVKKGDRIGFQFKRRTAIPYTDAKCSGTTTWYREYPEVRPRYSVGSIHQFWPIEWQHWNCRKYSLQVVVDPSL